MPFYGSETGSGASHGLLADAVAFCALLVLLQSRTTRSALDDKGYEESVVALGVAPTGEAEMTQRRVQ